MEAEGKKFLIETVDPSNVSESGKDLKSLGNDYLNAVSVGNDYQSEAQCQDKTRRTGSLGVDRAVGTKMKREILGCGGQIEIKCDGACIRFFHVRYNCKPGPQNYADQKAVKDLCKGKSTCTIKANRDLFKDISCPGKPDSDMKLYLTYACKGNRDTSRVQNPPRCRGGG